MLGLGTNNALDPCLLHPPKNPSGYACASHTPYSSTLDNGGTVTFHGTLDQVQPLWTVRSTATFRNPTGPTATNVSRSMTATVPVSANQNDPANTAIWNYIVSTKTSNTTTCDTSLINSAVIDEPMYVADIGPMFSAGINIGNSVQVKPLPAITNLPLGAPLAPNVHAAPAKPTFTG